MIRPANRGDLGRIFEIRDSVRENRLTNPEAVTEAKVDWFVDAGALWVWHEDDVVVGFSAADTRDGSIWALFVAPGHEGKGIGRALLTHACDAVRASGHHVATLSTAPGTKAEGHYRAAGWTMVGENDKGELIFQKPL